MKFQEVLGFFIEKGGDMHRKVYQERFRPSTIPKGGLKIFLNVTYCLTDDKRNILKRMKEELGKNYDTNSANETYDLHDVIKQIR